MNHARYMILENVRGKPLVIRDVGPWDRFPTVTDDAEDVVERLTRHGLLPAGRRLFYENSEGRVDEILHDRGRFLGFAPGNTCA